MTASLKPEQRPRRTIGGTDNVAVTGAAKTRNNGRYNGNGRHWETPPAEAPLEDIRHAATHSDISMTQKYSRESEKKTASVMRLRVAHRNKTENR